MALTNNDIIKKLRVALQLRDDGIIKILALVDYKISKSELGGFFRSDDHPKYMPLHDQILRNFLNGLVIYKRGPMEKKPAEEKAKKIQEKPSGSFFHKRPNTYSNKPKTAKNPVRNKPTKEG